MPLAIDQQSHDDLARDYEQALIEGQRMTEEIARLRKLLDAATYSLCTDDYATQQSVAANIKLQLEGRQSAG